MTPNNKARIGGLAKPTETSGSTSTSPNADVELSDIERGMLDPAIWKMTSRKAAAALTQKGVKCSGASVLRAKEKLSPIVEKTQIELGISTEDRVEIMEEIIAKRNKRDPIKAHAIVISNCANYLQVEYLEMIEKDDPNIYAKHLDDPHICHWHYEECRTLVLQAFGNGYIAKSVANSFPEIYEKFRHRTMVHYEMERRKLIESSDELKQDHRFSKDDDDDDKTVNVNVRLRLTDMTGSLEVTLPKDNRESVEAAIKPIIQGATNYEHVAPKQWIVT